MGRIGLLILCILSLAASSASARTALYEDEELQLYYGGYLRNFSSWQAVDGRAQELMALTGSGFSDVAINSLILRSELKLSAGDWFTTEVHSRAAWTMATEPVLGEGQGRAGAGVSVVPKRSLDLSTELIGDPDHSVDLDLDRLLFRFYLGDADLSLGRQAISWGNSVLFSVSDVWTTFSPFDLDTSQKRGVDALRLVWALNDWVELDFILADRGSVEDLSGGVRAHLYLSFGEAFVALAKSYEDLALAAGLAADIDTIKLRAEVMGRYDLDTSEVELPRATLGVDWFYSERLIVGVEAHLNGFGSTDSSESAYLLHAAQEPALRRGEGYLLGVLYAGAYLTYRPHDLIGLNLTSMVNLLDPTALVSWSATLEVLESVDLSIGAFHGIGEGFEFGLSGHTGYLQLAAFF